MREHRSDYLVLNQVRKEVLDQLETLYGHFQQAKQTIAQNRNSEYQVPNN